MGSGNLAVVDLGKARFKAFVWGPDGLAWSDSRETGALVKAMDLNGVVASAETLLRDAMSRSDEAVALSGSFLRDNADWREVVLPLFERSRVEAVVLSTSDEGRLLFESAQPGPNQALLDIGGGSVQLVWRDVADVNVRSWPIGTFAIEAQFSLVVGSTPWDEYRDAALAIEALVGPELPAGITGLTIGSNVMKDAFAALSRMMNRSASSWTWQELNACAQKCSELETERFEVVFPQNPDWMFGADKAMLVAAVFAKALGICAEGTNASISDGAAKLLIRQAKCGGTPSLLSAGYGYDARGAVHDD